MRITFFDFSSRVEVLVPRKPVLRFPLLIRCITHITIPIIAKLSSNLFFKIMIIHATQLHFHSSNTLPNVCYGKKVLNSSKLISGEFFFFYYKKRIFKDAIS